MRFKGLAVLAALFLVCISGCSGHHGRISKQTGNANNVNVAELKKNWNDHDIYYSTRNGRWAAGVIFEPKSNDTKIVGDSWIKIEDHETLSRSINEVNMMYSNAKVHNIEGPDGQIFGYIYYPSHLNLIVRRIDERTLHVSRLPEFKAPPAF